METLSKVFEDKYNKNVKDCTNEEIYHGLLSWTKEQLKGRPASVRISGRAHPPQELPRLPELQISGTSASTTQPLISPPGQVPHRLQLIQLPRTQLPSADYKCSRRVAGPPHLSQIQKAPQICRDRHSV